MKLPISRGARLALAALMMTSCGGGEGEGLAPGPSSPTLTDAGFDVLFGYEIVEAGIQWPERLLQFAQVAGELLSAGSSGTFPARIDCPALPNITGGAGSIDLLWTDAAPIGPGAGDRLTATFNQCPSILLNGIVSGTLVINLATPSTVGLGTPTQDFAGTLNLSGLSVGSTSFATLRGQPGFAFRNAREQTLLVASTDSAGLTVPLTNDSNGQRRSAQIRSARFVRENDHTLAVRRVTLEASYTVETTAERVSFRGEQRLPYVAAIGSAPLTGDLTFTADIGARQVTYRGGGDLQDTSQTYLTSTLRGTTPTTGFVPWRNIIQGYLWWDATTNLAPSNFGFGFGAIHNPPLRIRATQPAADPLAGMPVVRNPVEVVVYFTGPATQGSTASIRAVRVDAPQPDIDVVVEWNQALLVLRPVAPLDPGRYQLRGNQALASASGALTETVGPFLLQLEVR